MVINDDFTYPLVNCHITMERSTMLSMGKSTISMAIFNSYVKLPEGNFITGISWNISYTFIYRIPCIYIYIHIVQIFSISDP